MASTYSKIYIQFVFSPKRRVSHFSKIERGRISKFLFGLSKAKGIHPIAIHCMPDHLHVFVHLPTSFSCGQAMSYLKANSSRWINQQDWCRSRFEWQSGYGAFSYAQWDKEKIRNYVEGQEDHHRKITFQEEHRELLKSFHIDFVTLDLLE